MTKINNKKSGSSDLFMGILLTIVIALIPLICKYSLVPLRGDEIEVIRTGTGYNDVFSHSKSILLICMAVVTALAVVFDLFNSENLKLDFKALYVLLAGSYVFFAFISTVFSSHKSVAFLGATERYEGFIMWLCYIVFFITASAYVNSERKSKILLCGFMLSGLLVGFVGILQFFNIPVFETEFVSKLVMGSSYNGTPLQIKYDSVFATLYNPNCAGIYFGMMSSLFIVLAIFLPLKSKFKYGSIVIAVISFVCTVGTSSVGGFLGLGCGVMFAVIVAVCYYVFKKKSKITAVVSVAALIVIVIGSIVFINSDSVIAQKIKIITTAISSGETLDSSNNFYKDVTIEDNKGTIITANGNFTVSASADNCILLHNDIEMNPENTENNDASQSIIKHYIDGDMKWDLYTALSESENGFKNISLVATDALGNDRYFMFGLKDNKLSFCDKFSNPIDINEEIAAIGFKGVERLGSNRGYIWSRSIPLLFKNIIIGAGPDCFEFEFPQHDVKSKLMYLNDPYVIIDKPHNMFLQFGINTGLISLLIMLALFVLYIIQTIKSLFNDTNSFTSALKLGILAGVVSYLASGFTTDSVVSVAPVFWVLIGMGFGLNMIGVKILSREERQLEKMRKKLK